MSYRIAHVRFNGDERSYPVNCLRADIEPGDLVVIHMVKKGDFRDATVVRIEHLNWNCTNEILCRKSEYRRNGDGSIRIDRAPPDPNRPESIGDLARILIAEGWTSFEATSNVWRRIYLKACPTGSIAIASRTGGIDFKFWAPDEPVETRGNRLFLKATEETVVRNFYNGSDRDVFEHVLAFARDASRGLADKEIYRTGVGERRGSMRHPDHKEAKSADYHEYTAKTVVSVEGGFVTVYRYDNGDRAIRCDDEELRSRVSTACRSQGARWVSRCRYYLMDLERCKAVITALGGEIRRPRDHHVSPIRAASPAQAPTTSPVSLVPDKTKHTWSPEQALEDLANTPGTVEWRRRGIQRQREHEQAFGCTCRNHHEVHPKDDTSTTYVFDLNDADMLATYFLEDDQTIIVEDTKSGMIARISEHHIVEIIRPAARPMWHSCHGEAGPLVMPCCREELPSRDDDWGYTDGGGGDTYLGDGVWECADGGIRDLGR